MKNINRNQTELWRFVNPSHLLHIHLHRRGLAAKSSSFWNIYVLMPYPITIFESQPFSGQCSTLITADQCLSLWYMFSHNWRFTVLSFPWSLSTIFQNHYVKRIMGYEGLIRCPIWHHPIFSRPPYISWGRDWTSWRWLNLEDVFDIL